ncbi:hypothetical protein PTTG_27345 [Puccinia triticina 1-1 BBBD Race 1]|uniref:DUF659 domain-containing protein n=1 Tax=Puccinia triticina (isolate 1-1 / race 1 (BBBD)) TaxID=630390 RepID=A0A180GM50_PUCT1|nr:hypothetical protein PTTG_27345 [Puccinia triticina 1-1 BBBD Race 1]
MGSTRKQHKSSGATKSASSPHPQPPNLTQTPNTTRTNPTESESLGEIEDAISTPNRTQPLSGTTYDARKAQKVAANALSSTYKSYLPPKLSDKRDKQGRCMIRYCCRLCGICINCPTSDSSCSNLNKHASICFCKLKESNSNQSLVDVGIKGTGYIDSQEVNQLCAVWCSEAARPFSALVEASHKSILHPTVIKFLPARRAVSTDIQMIYLAIQQNYKAVLNAHQGALYLGVDALQSPNGFDILGAVIYRLVEDNSLDPKLEAMPLATKGSYVTLRYPRNFDFIWLAESHTEEHLARAVTLVVEKFGIQDKICGIVSNNTSNNKLMVNKLKKQKWVRFRGEPQWIRCFAHVLNLIARGILQPFGTQKNSKAAKEKKTVDQDDSDGLCSEGEDLEEYVPQLTQDGAESSSDDEDDESKDEVVEQNKDDDALSLSLDDIDNASDEKEFDTYTTAGCKQTLAQFCAIAKKLRYSPNSRIEFMQLCRKKGCKTPHQTRCPNQMELDHLPTHQHHLLQGCYLIQYFHSSNEWQCHKRHGIEQKFYLEQSDFNLACDMVEILNSFYKITKQISIYGSARISNIVVFIDQITEHLSTAISAYYSITGCSPLYWIAIVLHPPFRDEYFKLFNWEPEWISEAI